MSTQAQGTILVERFASARREADGAGPVRKLDTTVDRVIELVKVDGPPYRMRYKSEDRWGIKHTNVTTLRPKLRTRLENLELGDRLLVDPNDHGDPERVVVVRPVYTWEDPLDLPNCTENCEVIIHALRRAFPEHLNFGWYNRRKVAGSDTWSQHAWGNAYDPGGTFELVKQMGAFLIDNGRSGLLPIAKVIVNRQVWTPTGGLAPYNGSNPHTGHAHVEARPVQLGTPPLRLTT